MRSTRGGMLLTAALLLPTGVSAQLTVLEHAHAHNAYQHARPLRDALERGFNSVEADVHLVDGQLLVAHDRDSVVVSRTLESLYLAPLRAHIQRQNGHVYPSARPLTLLIDVRETPSRRMSCSMPFSAGTRTFSPSMPAPSSLTGPWPR